MVARRLNIVILAVAVCIAWMGCQPTIQRPTENKNICSPVQKRGKPKIIKLKLDDDSIRARLLMVELVQKDLRLTPDQVAKLRILCETHKARSCELHAKLLEIIPSSQTFPQDEFEAKMKIFRELSEDLKSKNEDFQTKILAMLTPSQTKRLEEIQLQATIPEALTQPEIVRKLNISGEQRTKIRTLCDQMYQKQSAGWSDLRNLKNDKHFIEFMKMLYKAQVETTNRTFDILAPEQRTELEKLTGKKIDLMRLYNAWIPEDAEEIREIKSARHVWH